MAKLIWPAINYATANRLRDRAKAIAERAAELATTVDKMWDAMVPSAKEQNIFEISLQNSQCLGDLEAIAEELSKLSLIYASMIGHCEARREVINNEIRLQEEANANLSG